MAEATGRRAATRQALAVDGLTKRYGGRVALDRLTLSLGAGEVLGLVGGNGGGKTTSLRILAGLLAPDAGGGHVLGFDLAREAERIRAHVGYMSQRFSLYTGLSVLENLRFRARVWGLPSPRAMAETTMEAFDLTRYARTPAGRLSGGWARRLQLAAAVVHAPELLLLDEPTAGLDAASRQDLWRRVAALAASGAGVIVSTHDLAEAEWCSRAALLSDGRVVAVGTPQEVAGRAPASAFLLSGGEPLALARQVSAVRGVMGSYPEGGALRVVADPAAEAELVAIAGADRARVARVAMRLEDAALAFGRSARRSA